MHILSYKPGHDGHVVHLADGKLTYSLEAEKDSGPRYGRIKPDLLLRAFARSPARPDVLAISGWAGRFRPLGELVEAGYLGVDDGNKTLRRGTWFGRDIDIFSSSHERSHIMCSYGMSPFPQGQPCYALVWEGVIGAFYRIDENLKITRLGTPVDGPGHKYAYAYGLADPGLPEDGGVSRREDAGKLMALASYGTSDAPDAEQKALIDAILDLPTSDRWVAKSEFTDSRYCNIGLDHPDFRDLAKHLSNALFERFHDFAKANMNDGLPLLIGGGCGLNCDWNSAWRATGLFSDVFVPPCTNDSGSAIGTAIDAWHHGTGKAKIDWSVYAGEEFIHDAADLSGFETVPRDNREIAARLAKGDVIALAQGRYEIGPRALGNRSLIAAPFSADTHKRLNDIKQREAFRPIAPICMEEEMARFFAPAHPSPHMLYFQNVIGDSLAAVTHVDGSARAQSVNATDNPSMYALLAAFKAETGTGVLCNTSLNFKGTGFINRLSDLVAYVRDRKIDGFIVDETVYRKTG
ncbi:MAG: carbamoyltransferase C-terminal domain-containing protein [Alphaproteobacteria bacterium]